MRTNLKRPRVVIAALSTLALAGAGAGVATATGTTASTTSHAGRTAPTPPAELTGTTLTQASAAAIAAVPGATVQHANAAGKMDPTGTAYDVHLTKTDGSHVVVREDSSFKVLSVKADRGPAGPGGPHGGPGGPGGHGPGGPGGGAALTGTTLTQATAAAIAAVPGGTVDHASAAGANDPSGAKYVVFVEKTDGSHVVVLEDASFKVVSTQTPPAPGQGGGKPPAAPAA